MEWTKRYNSHEPEYGQDNQYNSYEPQYGTDYGMDSYDKQPYGKDNNYDKSRDSVTVKKIICNNGNWNFNGDVIKDPKSHFDSLTADTLAEDEGANGASGNDRRGGNDVEAR